MARTQVTGLQVNDGTIQRPDLDTTHTGLAVITKAFAGAGLNQSQTGIDTGTGDVTLIVAVYANQQTSSYTISSADQARLITFNSSSAITATLPQATGSFINPWWAMFQNAGAGALTISPTTSTIDGATSLVLAQNQSVHLISVGGNYISLRGLSAASTGVTSAQSIANSLIFG